MIINKVAIVNKDLANKTVIVKREFDVPLEKVWRAWTESELLDKWWAPRPWKAATKSMDFREGGTWLYAMISPEDDKSWYKAEFKTIEDHKSFTTFDAFCNENGLTDTQFPGINRSNQFFITNTGTSIEIRLSVASEADLQKILDIGFEQAFIAALNNLDELLSK